MTHLIPAGIPELAKVSTSSEVKSGGVNVSFSKSDDHGSLGIIDGAASTSFLLRRISKYWRRAFVENVVALQSPRSLLVDHGN